MVYIYVTSGLLGKKTLEQLLKNKQKKNVSIFQRRQKQRFVLSEVVFSSDGTSALG